MMKSKCIRTLCVMVAVLVALSSVSLVSFADRPGHGGGDNGYIGEERACEIALERAEGEEAFIFYIFMDYNEDRPVYFGVMVDSLYYYEFEIDAVTGEILDWYQEGGEGYEDDDEEYISEEQVVEIALAQAKGEDAQVIILFMDFDYELDKVVYLGAMVDSLYYYEFEIDAVTGEVLDWYEEGAESDEEDEYISEEQVVEIALAQAKADGAQVIILFMDYDYELDKVVYLGAMRDARYYYEFEIDAVTGEILDWYEEETSPRPPQDPGYIGEERACEIALERAEGEDAFVYSIHLDRHSEPAVYEGEMMDSLNFYEFEIDALTGEVLEWEVEAVFPEEPEYISEEEAVEIALSYAEGENAEIVTIRFLDHYGVLTYKGKMVDSLYVYHFEIDAVTGEMLHFEKHNVGETDPGYIGHERAMEIALEKAEGEGAFIICMRLQETEAGWVYSGAMMDSLNYYEFEIDAKTGEVIVWEVENWFEEPVEYITYEQAEAIALENAEGENAEVVKLHLRQHGEQAKYAGKMVDSLYIYDFEIDAVTGEIITWEKRDNVPIEQQTFITPEQAMQTALALAEGDDAQIIRLRLEISEDKAVYSIQMVDSVNMYFVDIDAITGEVIKCETVLPHEPGDHDVKFDVEIANNVVAEFITHEMQGTAVIVSDNAANTARP